MMSKRKNTWMLKDWLEALAYIFAILGGLSASVLYLVNVRADAIKHNRVQLLRTWTNEGDITSTELRFIDLKLENLDGDIVGTLTSPRLSSPLDVSVDVGWRSSTVSILALHGRSIVSVATADVSLGENDNRLEWEITSSGAPAYLPPSTVLWPVPAGVSQ